jgi:PhnB protein
MDSINAYIGFNGRCREAMSFYKDCFGGELDLQQVDGSPMEQFWPQGKGQIFHSALTQGGKVLIMGSDMGGAQEQVNGNNIQLAVSCTSEDEIHSLFDKLGKGGTVLAPINETFWNALFGSVKDRFGINWMLNYSRT